MDETPKVSDSRPPIPALTGLRCVAALLVLFAHLLPKAMPYPNPPNWYFQLGSVSAEGMTLFMVLSGFVIHYNYSASFESGGAKGIFNFFVARGARIYPLYVVLLLLQVAYGFGYSQLTHAMMAALPIYLLLMQTWFYWPLGQYGLVYELSHIPSLSWSVSTEWFFYLSFPALYLVLRQFKTIGSRLFLAGLTSALICSAIAALSLNFDAVNHFGIAYFGKIGDLSVQSQYSFFHWLVYFSPYSRIFEFILGCICASIFLSLRTRAVSQREEKFGLAILIAGIVATMVLHSFMFGPESAHGSRYFVLAQFNSCYGFALLMATIIFCCARYSTPISRALSSWPVVLCGEASYSLYLLHILVVMAVRWESAPVTSAKIMISDSIRLIFAALSAIGLALITWRFIEVPARRWIRKALTIPLNTNERAPDHTLEQQTASR